MNQTDTNGFTLLEVMISMVIFTIGILAVGQMQLSAIQGNDVSSEFTTALFIAQNQIDHLLTLDYAHMDLEDKNDNGAGGLSENSAATADHNMTVHKKYQVLWNTAENHPENGSTAIRIFVRWKNGPKTTQVSLDTLKIE